MAIYARLENGTYAEVTGVYKSDGTEITEIFKGDRLVYSATNEIYGTVPLYYDGLGYELIDYLFSGNAVQDGTPTPDAPMDVVGCGVRTGNLAPPLSEFISGYVDVNGNIHNASGIVQEKSSEYIQITPNTDYAFAFQNGDFPTGESGAWRAVGIYDENKTFIKRVGGNVSEPLAFNSGANAKFARLSYRSYGSNLNTMLNTGSTALPYEPYGFKLGISSGGENLAWTGWAQDFVGRIGAATRASIVTDDGRECLQYNVSAGYGDYDTKYIFKTEWKENTRYSISFYGKRPTGMTTAGVMQLIYTDDTHEDIRVQSAGVGNYVQYVVMSAAGKTVKSLCALYSSGSFIIDVNTFMVNEGDTAKPYSPYNRTSTPIYLGQVETTRRVKKLVLTGEEEVAIKSGNAKWFIPIDDLRLRNTASILWYCSHYQAVANNAPWASYDYMISWSTVDIGSSKGLRIRDVNFLTDVTVADFKSYLAAQYQNGTPVTVWYVLATEETAIVNEPLMKIGDYADTVSAAQAGVTIPTVSGANVLDMTSPVKPSEMYIKGKGIKPTGYGQLTDVNGVNIFDKDSRPIYVHGQ